MEDIFSSINKANKRKLLKYLETSILTYQPDVYLTELFRRDNLICIVISGEIEVLRNDYDGSIRFVESLQDDSVFSSTLIGMKYGDYEIVTKEESKIIIIDYNNLINFNESRYPYYNTFMKNLFKIYNDKIDEKNQRIEVLTQKSIRNKLLEYFKIISKKNNSKIIYIPGKLSDLADYLSVDRCAMSREIKKLKEDGLIEIKNKRISLKY